MAAGENIIAPRRALVLPRVGRRHPFTLAILGLFVLAVVFVAGVAIGSVPISPAETLAIAAHRLFGLNITVTWQPSTEAIIWELRIPRVLFPRSSFDRYFPVRKPLARL